MSLAGVHDDALAAVTQISNDLIAQYNQIVNDNLAAYSSVMTSDQVNALKKMRDNQLADFKRIYSQSGTVPIYDGQPFVQFIKKGKKGRLLNQRVENLANAMQKRAEQNVNSFVAQLEKYAAAGIAAKEKAAQKPVTQTPTTQTPTTPGTTTPPPVYGGSQSVQDIAAELYPQIYAQIAAQMPTASPQQIADAATSASMDYAVAESAKGGDNKMLYIAGGIGLLGIIAVLLLRKRR